MNRINVVPLPCRTTESPGVFVFGRATRLVAAEPAEPVAWLLHDALRAGTGLTLPVVNEVADAESERDGGVFLHTGSPEVPHPEGYVLDVRPRRIELTSATAAGLARGVQTLRQLLPPGTARAAPVSGGPFAVPCCRIEDEPRFAWRGLMIDVARHFMPKPFLLRLVDLAAMHRMNVVHLHLTDDQGWRLEVPSWPRLTGVGAWRRGTARGPVDAPAGHDGTPHGGYYTLDDLREVVSYASARHVDVVPEVGLPGHVQAALSAYPELGATGPHEVGTQWGHSPHVLAPGDRSAAFVTDVLDVVTDVFPSPYVHVGGDHCPRDEWRGSARAREAARTYGLPSVDFLQSWFLRFALERLAGQGRRGVCWDLALEDGGVPAETVIMVWRDWLEQDLGETALARGHDILRCPAAVTNLDHRQSAASAEPLGFPGAATSFEDVGAFDPAPEDGPASGGTVLGTQAQLWTEHMPTPRHVEYMAFPRLGALAEAAWTPVRTRRGHPWADRLPGYLARLEALGVNYRPPNGPLPWQRAGVPSHSDRSTLDEL